MNNICFASKYLKWTFEKRSYEIGFINYGHVMKYLLNMAQHVLYFASKYLKRTFEKIQIKSGPPNMVLV